MSQSSARRTDRANRRPDETSRTPRLDTDAVIQVASFRAALRSFLGESDRVARASGLTPQRHLLLLMIKGAPDGSERATITELADRLKLEQHSVTELAQRAEKLGLLNAKRPSTTVVSHTCASPPKANVASPRHSRRTTRPVPNFDTRSTRPTSMRSQAAMLPRNRSSRTSFVPSRGSGG